ASAQIIIIFPRSVIGIRRAGGGGFTSRDLLDSAVDAQLGHAGMSGQRRNALDDLNCERGWLAAVNCYHTIFGGNADCDSSQSRKIGGAVLQQSRDAVIREAQSQARLSRHLNAAQRAD